MELKFDEKGLIPAIVQDHYTKQVLTLAYMNRESLAITIDEQRTCFGVVVVRNYGVRERRVGMSSAWSV